MTRQQVMTRYRVRRGKVNYGVKKVNYSERSRFAPNVETL